MNISGIRPSIGFYDYNSIRPVQPSTEPVSAVQPVDKPEAVSTEVTEQEISKAREKQTLGAYDYAATYNPDETFEMKGADSDIKSLDIANAVSNMQKDSVLRQYQYFVGSQLGAESQGSTMVGTIRGTEDFSL